MTTRKAVGVRLTARVKDELQRTARRRKTTVSAVVRDRLHAAGAFTTCYGSSAGNGDASVDEDHRVNTRVGRARG